MKVSACGELSIVNAKYKVHHFEKDYPKSKEENKWTYLECGFHDELREGSQALAELDEVLDLRHDANEQHHYKHCLEVFNMVVGSHDEVRNRYDNLKEVKDVG